MGLKEATAMDAAGGGDIVRFRSGFFQLGKGK